MAAEKTKTGEELDMDKLKEICRQLSAQNQQLAERLRVMTEQLRETSLTHVFTVLKVLVDIVNGNNQNYSPEFIKYCCGQIEEKIYDLTAPNDESDNASADTANTAAGE